MLEQYSIAQTMYMTDLTPGYDTDDLFVMGRSSFVVRYSKSRLDSKLLRDQISMRNEPVFIRF